MPTESGRPEAGGSIGVVVVEPFPVIRAGLIRTIAEHPDLDVVADVSGAEEAIGVVERLPASRVVILVAMGLAGEKDAYWLIRTIRSRSRSQIILGMGTNADPQVVSRALFAGADGFVDKSVELDEFLSAIEQASGEEVVIAGPAAASVGQIAEGIERRRSVSFRLTRREREVLTIAAEGLTARQMADRLGVRERTITTHLARIYGKLGVGSRIAALRVASRSGLLSIGSPD